MAAFLRFFDPDTSVILFDLPVTDFKLDFGLNQSTTWSASVSLDTPGIDAVFQGMTIEFYVDGERIFEGILQQFSRDIINEKPILALTGRSFLDNLYAFKSYPLSYYDDVPLLGVMTELLLQGDWALGDISTLNDVDQTFTKDMRDESTLLTQLNKVLEGVPFTYWREGQTRLGTRTLDIGLFNQESLISALAPDDQAHYDEDDDLLHTINSLTYEVNFVDAVYGVRATGGEIKESSTVDRVVNLGDALGIDPLLRVDTEFQIIEDLNERAWSVVNVADYPYPGGRVISTEDTRVTVLGAAVGDPSGAAVENWRNILLTFIPYSGLLRSITIWLGTIDATFLSEVGVNFDFVWQLFEVDPANNTTLVSDALHYQVIDPALLFTDRTLRLEPDTDVILEPGKLYGVAFSTTVAPTADVVRCHIQLADRASTSSSFSFRLMDNAFPVNGSVFNAASYNRVPIIEVVTDPIGTIFAGFKTEKQTKFAPPKGGAIAVAAEVQRAGYSLYLWAKNYLLEHPPIKKEYTMNTVGTTQFVPVGDKIYVKGRAYVQDFDEISGLTTIELFEDIDGFLRVIGYSVSFNDEHIEINYKLLDGEGILITEQLVALYDLTEDEKPPEGDIFASPWGLLLDTINVNINNVSPNAHFADGTDAYEVVVSIFAGSVPSLPTNTEWVYLAGNPYGTSPDGRLRIEVIELPVFSSTGQVRFLVGFTTRGWEYGDEADLVVKLIWR